MWMFDYISSLYILMEKFNQKATVRKSGETK